MTSESFVVRVPCTANEPCFSNVPRI